MKLEHSEFVTSYIEEEIKAGRVSGPFPSPPLEGFRCSPIGAVEKSEPSQYRIIMNLSAPKGRSVNDFIPKESFSLSYAFCELIPLHYSAVALTKS